MSAPAVFRRRAIWYETEPSVLTCVQKLSSDKTPGGPVKVIYLPFPVPHIEGKQGGSPHQTTHEEIAQVRKPENGGCTAGLYVKPGWFDGAGSGWTDLLGHPLIDPIVFRKLVSKHLLDHYQLHEPVMFEFEKIPSDWMVTFLVGTPGQQGWRGKDGNNAGGANPWRESAWNDASWQIGNYSDRVLQLLALFGFAFFCELYAGQMEPVKEREDAIKEIQYRGFPGTDVMPFLDASKDNGSFREGCLFTTNRFSPYLFT